MSMAPPSSAYAEPLLETTRRLVGALQQEPSDERRLALAKRLVRQLGDTAYPVFLKILLVVAESNDDDAKQAIADLLASAAQRLDLPSGQLGAWGSSGGSASSRGHLLGPIEYLTVWYCQQTQRPMLEEPLYADALGKLLTLFDRNPALRKLYSVKLNADAGNALEGTYTRDTRDTLSRIAQRWLEDGSTPADVVRAAVGGDASAGEVPPGWIVHRL